MIDWSNISQVAQKTINEQSLRDAQDAATRVLNAFEQQEGEVTEQDAATIAWFVAYLDVGMFKEEYVQ